ncbi:MAG: hypothetical protein E7555_00845 [Ruminococcaceae bacterium]|nr:hypothetical protein [Oscillospiraceae bacterium]
MKKRNDNFDLSGEEVVDEFMKAYSSHSHHKHHHHHHSHDNSSSSDKEKTEKKSSEKKERKEIPLFLRILIIIVAALFLLVILGAGAVLVMHRRGMSDINKKKEEATIETIDSVVSYDDSGKTVEYKGKKYVYNEDIVTAAFLGIDDKSFGVNITDEYGTAGQADTIMVLAYDTKTGEISIITVPRDSMVDVDVYSASGNFARTEEMHICLSFAYGDGAEKSCENVIKSIERLLMGVPVDSYFSLRVKGVDSLNDAVGGIELTSIETIGQFTKGEKIKLTDSSARFYCTARDKTKIDSDALRRQRQIQYVKAYSAKVMSLAKDDIGIISKLYNTAKKYSVTDISLSSAVYLGTELVTNSAKINKVTSLQGEYVSADKFPQFIVDKESTYEMILDIFYNEA